MSVAALIVAAGRGTRAVEAGAAREDGEGLRETYPPRLDPSLIRGEECVICPHYGQTCDGIEREWWSDAEWEEFPDRVG